jgi:hypothetical protein
MIFSCHFPQRLDFQAQANAGNDFVYVGTSLHFTALFLIRFDDRNDDINRNKV